MELKGWLIKREEGDNVEVPYYLFISICSSEDCSSNAYRDYNHPSSAVNRLFIIYFGRRPYSRFEKGFRVLSSSRFDSIKLPKTASVFCPPKGGYL